MTSLFILPAAPLHRNTLLDLYETLLWSSSQPCQQANMKDADVMRIWSGGFYRHVPTVLHVVSGELEPLTYTAILLLKMGACSCSCQYSFLI